MVKPGNFPMEKSWNGCLKHGSEKMSQIRMNTVVSLKQILKWNLCIKIVQSSLLKLLNFHQCSIDCFSYAVNIKIWAVTFFAHISKK